MNGAGREDRLQWSYFSLAALPFAIYLASVEFHGRFVDCTAASPHFSPMGLRWRGGVCGFSR